MIAIMKVLTEVQFYRSLLFDDIVQKFKAIKQTQTTAMIKEIVP